MTALRELKHDLIKLRDCTDSEMCDGDMARDLARKWIEILDAEGDGGAAGMASKMPGTSAFTMAVFKADDVPEGTDLYTQPARSGVVREWKDQTGFSAEGIRDEANNWTRRETGKEMLLNYAAALEHFAKGERHE